MITWIKALWARYVAYTLNQPDTMPLKAPVVPVEPVTAPTPAIPTPVQPEPVQSHLDTFTLAIANYEGKPGDLNYQLNNPGDCRPSPVGYLPKYRPVIIVDTDTDPAYPYHKGKFAKFPTLDIGMEYLQNLILNWVTLHPEWTFADFFSHYAPSSDANNPDAYAMNVAAKCGVDKLAVLSTYLS